jgi:energy-coupling factor transporter transmembrane protein EcfT
MDTVMDWVKREFQFDDDDLITNRQGIMSKSQKTRAVRGSASLFFLALAGLLIIVILVCIEWLTTRDIFNIVSGIIVGLGLMGICFWMGWRSRKAAKSGVVKSITGKVRFHQEKKKLYLCIGNDIRMELDKKAQEIFSLVTEYRFYYSEADKTILSLETP